MFREGVFKYEVDYWKLAQHSGRSAQTKDEAAPKECGSAQTYEKLAPKRCRSAQTKDEAAPKRY